ncbi:hypothetical protein SSX86_033204 [Deinandra increscens subsp. villosa]|uniref:Fe2OG dioxygenase domain-containing protein n=1 Tax=Deinandra increscens subsp. villosa TaxID=3103831 RepID=A0AAP0GGZ5_9ASTR
MHKLSLKSSKEELAADSSFCEDVNINEKDESKLKENPFSLILPRSVSHYHGTNNPKESSYELLQSGMILLKNYLTISHQVEIVKICEELGGFYQPGYKSRGKDKLHMMCLGRRWDPQTQYNNDKTDAVPMIPDKLVSFVKMALKDSQALINSEDELPSMSPDICIVNFYSTAGGLGLHQDRDESIDSLSRGLPVVSISIGDAAEFLYGDKGAVKKAKKMVLKSGDVLIFGGKSRLVFHGVKSVIPSSAPLALLKETMLRPGRLNLTFRQF